MQRGQQLVHSGGTLLPRLMYRAGASRKAVARNTAIHSAMPPAVSRPPHGTCHRWLYAPQSSRPHLRSSPSWTCKDTGVRLGWVPRGDYKVFMSADLQGAYGIRRLALDSVLTFWAARVSAAGPML